mmetsp:Transcript_62770/g.137460  ORF Transcript_62770/g.137460 Transcript_62770/m.137460 type:complete len:91 (-) Transcript_62770:959-1231(-)
MFYSNPVHHEGNPKAKRHEAPTEIVVPTTKSRSGTKSCSNMEDMMQVRMIERAVLKQPCVAPAYFNITAHNSPPKAFIAMTNNTRLLYPA